MFLVWRFVNINFILKCIKYFYFYCILKNGKYVEGKDFFLIKVIIS